MSKLRRFGLAATVVAGSSASLFALAGAAGAAVGSSDQAHFFGAKPAVFVQTDNPAGNAIVAYDRNRDGTLSYSGTYPTGGLGGVTTGSAVDHLASQGSLDYDQSASLLFAVNAGSNTVSVFSVRGDQLFLRQIVSSGGTFPVSVAVHGNLAYVLNAEGGGSIQGYFVGFGGVSPVPSWNRALGLGTTSTSAFTSTPGEVAFSPNGNQLLVTTKNSTNAIDVFNLSFFGGPSATPVVNSEPGTVPFGVAFDSSGQLLVAEAGPNAIQSFTLSPNGSLTPIALLATDQTATCWIAGPVDGSLFYASNAGSGTLSGARSHFGELSAVGNTPTDGGTVDAAISGDGQYLYAQTGMSGIVDEFRINVDGSLTEVGSVTVPNAQGGEGIAAQ
jgi:6-phosphogluconolactonase (cycloisomerase 2 family)